MSNQRKTFVFVGAIVLSGVAILFILNPFSSDGGDDGMNTRREVPTKRPAPGARPGMEMDG